MKKISKEETVIATSSGKFLYNGTFDLILSCTSIIPIVFTIIIFTNHKASISPEVKYGILSITILLLGIITLKTVTLAENKWLVPMLVLVKIIIASLIFLAGFLALGNLAIFLDRNHSEKERVKSLGKSVIWSVATGGLLAYIRRFIKK